MAAWATLLFYVTAIGTGFAITHLCLGDHFHLNGAGAPQTNVGCCGYGSTALPDCSDEHDEGRPSSEVNCCFGFFQVQRTSEEHATRAQQTDNNAFSFPLILAFGYVTPGNPSDFPHERMRSGLSVDRTLAGAHTLPLLI